MNESVGKLILRVVLGVVVLLHGIAKLRGGIGAITGMVTAAGLPAFVAYGAYLGEVLAPVMVLLGWYASVGAALIAVTMVFALFLAHGEHLLALNAMGGWAIELQVMLLAVAVAVALLGPGRYAVNGR